MQTNINEDTQSINNLVNGKDYFITEISRITGISRGLLMQWKSKGWLVPSLVANKTPKYDKTSLINAKNKSVDDYYAVRNKIAFKSKNIYRNQRVNYSKIMDSVLKPIQSNKAN